MRWVSPRRRRYERFLDTLDLDPDELPRPAPSPSDRDFIICGSPRTGTSLVTAMVDGPPHVVTVMEPWDGMKLAPADLFRSIRQEISATGSVGRGRLNIGALSNEGEVRWTRDRAASRSVHLERQYLLGVKWPAFWRYLDLLPGTKFLVCLRHPAEVIASYKKRGGRLGQGLEYRTAFNRRMNEYLLSATDDSLLRQVMLYDYIHERLLPHLERPNVLTVRYERWFVEPKAVLGEIEAFLNVPLAPGAVEIRTPAGDQSLDQNEMQVIRAHCSTAQALGYKFDRTAFPAA